MEFSMDMFHLDGKVALITGAVYDIGFEIARSLAITGAKVVFNSLDQESVDEGIVHYKEAGIDARDCACDVTDRETIQAMVQQIEEDVSSASILINNAEIIKRTSMIETDAADFRQVIDMDLNAPFIVSKAAIPDMIEKGDGKTINICSITSELRCEAVSVYAVAKGGLKMLTKDITPEYGQYSIQCDGIGSDYIATPQTVPLCETQENGERRPFNQFIVGRTSAARQDRPTDLARSSTFLASSASDLVNGRALYMDGDIPAYTRKQP